MYVWMAICMQCTCILYTYGRFKRLPGEHSYNYAWDKKRALLRDGRTKHERSRVQKSSMDLWNLKAGGESWAKTKVECKRRRSPRRGRHENPNELGRPGKEESKPEESTVCMSVIEWVTDGEGEGEGEGEGQGRVLLQSTQRGEITECIIKG